jgi:hypothetical protein
MEEGRQRLCNVQINHTRNRRNRSFTSIASANTTSNLSNFINGAGQWRCRAWNSATGDGVVKYAFTKPNWARWSQNRFQLNLDVDINFTRANTDAIAVLKVVGAKPSILGTSPTKWLAFSAVLLGSPFISGRGKASHLEACSKQLIFVHKVLV